MGRIVGLVFDSAPAEPADLTKAELKAQLDSAGVEPADLTKAELKAQLDSAGVEYDDKMTKDELVALLKE